MATICKACGAEISVGTKFCGLCGTPVEIDAAIELVAEDDETSMVASVDEDNTPIPAIISVPEMAEGDITKGNVKKYVKLAIGLLIVVGIAAIAIYMLKPSNYAKAKGYISISQNDDCVAIITSMGNRIEIEGYLMDNSKSADGTKAIVRVGEKSGSTEYGGIYLITDKAQLIADDIYGYVFSASGDAVAYVKEYASDGTAELWLNSAGKAELITKDLAFSDYSNSAYAISPDGSAIVFITSDNDEHTGLVWNGKESKLGKDIEPLAVSNGAKYIYYTKNDSLYVQTGTSGDIREKLGENVYTFHTNKDLTQIVYNYNSKAYIAKDGNSRESLSGSISSFIIPTGTASTYSNGISIHGLSDFADTFYKNSDNGIVHIDSKYETNSIVKDADTAYLASNGKTLTYLKNDSIYRIDGQDNKATAIKLVDEDVVSFIATADGNEIYYANTDDEIFYQKGTNKSTMVTNDFSIYNSNRGYFLFKGSILYYVSDDELYTSSGERGKAVSGFNYEVKNVNAGMFYLAVTVDDGGDILNYRSVDGQNFIFLSQD